jgi:glycosyltransferase involved in cell wall biosynthesis
MRKIAVFHPSNDLYGSDRIIASIIEGLVQNNYYVSLFLPDKEGELEEYLKKNNIRVGIIKLKHYPLIYRKLFTLSGLITFLITCLRFKKYDFSDYDVFYINTLANSFVLPFLKRYRKSIFTHVHEILVSPPFIKLICHNLVYRHSNKIICVSFAVQSNFNKNQRVKTIVIHNGIKPIRKINPLQPHDILIFVLIGRLMPEKGQWFLLETLKDLDRSLLKKMYFILVGSPPLKYKSAMRDILEIIEKYKLREFVAVYDFKEDISDYINAADVCLVPSIMKDPFPTTILEAMSVEKPVIATDTGGSVEMVTNGITGFLIKPNDTKEFGNKLTFFLNNREALAEMGLEAKKVFDSEFGVEGFIKKILEVICVYP